MHYLGSLKLSLSVSNISNALEMLFALVLCLEVPNDAVVCRLAAREELGLGPQKVPLCISTLVASKQPVCCTRVLQLPSCTQLQVTGEGDCVRVCSRLLTEKLDFLLSVALFEFGVLC